MHTELLIQPAIQGLLAPALFTVLWLVMLLVAEQRESLQGKWLTKPLASAGFLWLALLHGLPATGWGRAMIAAFALCWVGDVLLIPKDKRAFLAGLGAFLLGHVAFAVAFAWRGLDRRAVAAVALPLAMGAVLVLQWLWPHLSRTMRGPVVAYIAAICSMVALAMGTSTLHPDGAIVVGAVAFFASDLAVARNRFVSPGFLNRAWGLPLYYGAQLLLAAAVLHAST